MVFCTDFLDGWWSWEPHTRQTAVVAVVMTCDNGKLSSYKIWTKTAVNVTSHKALSCTTFVCTMNVHTCTNFILPHSCYKTYSTPVVQQSWNTYCTDMCLYIQSLVTDGRMHALNFLLQFWEPSIFQPRQ